MISVDSGYKTAGMTVVLKLGVFCRKDTYSELRLLTHSFSSPSKKE